MRKFFLMEMIVAGMTVISVLGVAQTKDNILFYSEQCPHCQIVEKFMKAHPETASLKIHRENVADRAALQQLIEVAKQCQLTKDVPIPLLWTGEKCITGDRDVIVFLTANSQETSK
jgi:hypothetical protein